jgi:hypothetical protein
VEQKRLRILHVLGGKLIRAGRYGWGNSAQTGGGGEKGRAIYLGRSSSRKSLGVQEFYQKIDETAQSAIAPSIQVDGEKAEYEVAWFPPDEEVNAQK